MKGMRPATILLAALLVGAIAGPAVWATGVPISGFLPMAGISLTNKYVPDDDPTFTFFQAKYEASLSGTQLGAGGVPHYDIALVDTGAAATLLTTASDTAFNIAGAGFRGTEPLPIGGATGSLTAITNDSMAIFASGLGPTNRVGTSPLVLDTAQMIGQSSISLATLPPESDLPNVLGIPFTSQYATFIRNDQPQIFSVDGKTVRTPQVQFVPLGSGGQGIIRRAPITLDDPSSFLQPPQYIYNFNNIFAEPPVPLTDNPSYPTLLINGSFQAAAAYFVSVNVANKGQSLTNTNFLLDTGADISVVSEINAVRLGFDPVLDTPDFTLAVQGSGGVLESVPGFYVEQFTIQAVGGSITLNHVPFVVLDFPNPAHAGNIAEGIIGMNALAGRNLVIDPKPQTGGGGVGPSLYISDPVTTGHDWATNAASGSFATTTNWNAVRAPDVLWIANARNVSGSAQEAVVSADATVWELNVSGNGAATMNVRVQSGKTLTTFSGVSLEAGGGLTLEGGTLDTQYVDIRGGTLAGSGTIMTGSGPVPGQVENRIGTVSPGNSTGTLHIIGRFSNGADGLLAMELGGMVPGTDYDQLLVDGPVAIDGTLAVSLINPGGGLFTPTVGNMFTLVTATEISGEFAGLQLPGGINWRVRYDPSSIRLIVGQSGDYNHDGIVDAADYTVWRNSLGSTTWRDADGDGSGVVDAGDYLVWKNHFGMTGPSDSSIFGSGAVPEPATATLLLFAILFLLTNRTRGRSCGAPFEQGSGYS